MTSQTRPASSAARDQIAAVIRDFPFDDYGLNDVAYLLEDTPDTQEWVPALATAVLAVVLPVTRITAGLARDSEATVQRVITAVEDGPPSGMAIEGEWERGWDFAMDAIREALAPTTNQTKEQ